MTLYGDAKKAQSIRAGIYHLAPSMVNGKSYWVQDSGRQVIWCDPSGWWSIGKIACAGTAACAIYTEDSVCVPQKASNWKYHDGNEWKSGQGLVSVSLQNWSQLLRSHQWLQGMFITVTMSDQKVFFSNSNYFVTYVIFNNSKTMSTTYCSPYFLTNWIKVLYIDWY